MTNQQAFVTDEGLELSQDAKINGKFIKIVSFGCSENLGPYLATRNFESINPMWVNLPISGTTKISQYVQQINLTIPPNALSPNNTANTSNKNISELYIFAVTSGSNFTVNIPTSEIIVDATFYNSINTGDPIKLETTDSLPVSSPTLSQDKVYYAIKTSPNKLKLSTTKNNALNNIFISLINSGVGVHNIGKFFLFAFCQFTPEPLYWIYTGELKLRTQLELTNINIADTLKFVYTQATEISDHNLDPNAHPFIQEALKYSGIYPQGIDFVYKGQNLIKDAIFHASVDDEMIVYKKLSDGKFYPALATTGEQTKFVGFANLTDKTIRFGGVIQTSLSVPINQDIYLSDVTAGTITTNITPYKIGRSLGNGLILMGSSTFGGGGSINYLTDLIDVDLVGVSNKQVLFYDGTNVTPKWVNKRLFTTDIADIDPSTVPTNKNVLMWDVNIWKPKALNLSDLNDTQITSLTSNQVLKYNGFKWVNAFLGIGVSTFTDINQINFGAGFSVNNTGNSVTINYSGSGSNTMLGLSDVVNSYPNDGGLVIYDNYPANSNPEKVSFIGHNTNRNDLTLNYPDGSVFSPVYKVINNIPNQGDITFPNAKTEFLMLSKVFAKNSADQYSNAPVGFTRPHFIVEGSGISGLDNTDNNFTNKIIFGNNINGNLDVNGVLTINSSGGGISGVTPVSSFGTSLMYSPSQIRNLQAGINCNFELLDENGAIVPINLATRIKINSKMDFTNRSFGSGVILARSSSPYYTIDMLGIRAGAGISITAEDQGANRNYVISATGGGGGGGGLILGSNNTVNSSYGLGMIVNTGQAGFLVNGVSLSGSGVGFQGINLQAGVSIEQSLVGIDLRNADNTNAKHLVLDGSCKNQINFQSYGNISNLSSLSGMDYGSLIYMNYTGPGGGEGFYLRVGSGNLVKLSFTTIGLIP